MWSSMWMIACGRYAQTAAVILNEFGDAVEGAYFQDLDVSLTYMSGIAYEHTPMHSPTTYIQHFYNCRV